MNGAVAELYNRDAHLLKVRCSERAIAHRLALYLEERITGWSVDCEYNRKGDATKRLLTWADLLRERGLEPPTNEERQYIYPDIIVHERGTDRNLLVIEIKVNASTLDKDRDTLKLRAARADLGYEHGVFLDFRSDAKRRL